MKKTIRTFGIIALAITSSYFLNSCKDKDDGKPSGGKCQLLTVDFDGDLSTLKYNSSNQLVEITGEEINIKLEYDTKGHIVKEIYIEDGDQYSTLYLYHADGSINMEIEEEDTTFYNYTTGNLPSSSKNEWGTTTYTWSGGNLIKEVEVDDVGTYEFLYEYDNKKLALSFLAVNHWSGQINNVTKTTSVNKDKNGGIISNEISTSLYEYNSNGYPTKVTTNYDGDTEINLYTYKCD